MQGPLCNEYTLHDQIIIPEFKTSLEIQNLSVNHSHLSPTASIFVPNTTSHLYLHLHNVRHEKKRWADYNSYLHSACLLALILHLASLHLHFNQLL